MPDNTPKWTYNPIPGYQFVVRIEDEIDGMMLVAAHIKPGQEAEAHRVLTLASAAPDLYDALLEVVCRMHAQLKLYPEQGAESGALKILEKWGKVLAKARGGQTDGE